MVIWSDDYSNDGSFMIIVTTTMFAFRWLNWKRVRLKVMMSPVRSRLWDILLMFITLTNLFRCRFNLKQTLAFKKFSLSFQYWLLKKTNIRNSTVLYEWLWRARSGTFYKLAILHFNFYQRQLLPATALAKTGADGGDSNVVAALLLLIQICLF